MTVLLSIASGSNGWAGKYQPLATFALVFVFVTFMLVYFRRGMTTLSRTSWWKSQPDVVRLMVIIALLTFSALICDLIQVHSLLGAVLCGASLPSNLKAFVSGHVDLLNRALFLPLFFGSAGLKVNITGNMRTEGYILLVVVGVNVLSRVVSVVVPAIKMGYPAPTAWAIVGCLQSKGVIELVLANIFRERSIIGPAVFNALVLKALICTLLCKPWLIAVHRVFKVGPEIYAFGVAEIPHDAGDGDDDDDELIPKLHAVETNSSRLPAAQVKSYCAIDNSSTNVDDGNGKHNNRSNNKGSKQHYGSISGNGSSNNNKRTSQNEQPTESHRLLERSFGDEDYDTISEA